MNSTAISSSAIGVATTPIATVSSFIPTVVWVLYRVEFMPNLFIVLPVSLLNLHVVGKSSVLHLNLKVVFCIQSLVVLIYTACRCIHTSVNEWVVGNRLNAWPGEWLLGAVEAWAMGICSWMGFVLLAERIYATIRVTSYERSRSQYFNLVWILLLLAQSMISVQETLNKSSGITVNTLVSTYVSMVLNVAAWLLLGYLYVYNRRRYARMAFELSNPEHNLSVRYQLAENIRTLRQLSPVLFTHIVCSLVGAGIVFSSYYHLIELSVSASGVFLAVVYLNYSIMNLIVHCVIIK